MPRRRSGRSSTWGSCRWPEGSSRGPAEIAVEQRYPVADQRLRNCGLVQIVDPVDPAILFQDYSFATGTIRDWSGTSTATPSGSPHAGTRDRSSSSAQRRHTYRRAWKQRGIRSLGVDLAANITEMAREQGLGTSYRSIRPPIVDELPRADGQVDWSPEAMCSPTMQIRKPSWRLPTRAGPERRALSGGDVRRRPARPAPVGHPVPRAPHLLLARDVGTAAGVGTDSSRSRRCGSRCTAARCVLLRHATGRRAAGLLGSADLQAWEVQIR